MKIAMIQHNPTVGDFSGNVLKIGDGYFQGVARGADIVVAPELAIWGYPPMDQLLVPEMVTQHSQAFHTLRSQIGKTPYLIGAVRKNEHVGMPLLNSAVLFQDGLIHFFRDKQLLPNYDVFDERRYFETGKGWNWERSFTCNDEKCAVLICEDIWNGSEIPTERHLYSENPIANLHGRGIDVLFVVNASPYYWGKGNVRFDLVSGIAKRLGCAVVYVNQVGGNDELVFDGRSFAVNAEGKCIAAAKVFEEDVVVFDTGGPEVPYQNDLGDISQLYDSLVLSVRDYAKKCHFEGALLGLSGGVDSSLVAALAVDALGSENVEVVMMPSEYTADMSNEDAKTQAEALGVLYTFLPIETPFHAFLDVLSERFVFVSPTPDVADENLQARTRGALLMYISNKTGKLLLTTGNKSEMSVGYATLYGDMAGGFAPIKDVPKMLVYALARYRNTISPVIPERVLTRAPSAELAPGQKDQDSLPPYEILDPILKLYVEQYLSVAEIAARGFDIATVQKVARMVDRNEYKRRQSPPGTNVTPRAFDRARRFPIAAKGVSE